MPRGYAPGLSVPKRYPKLYLPILRAEAHRYGIPARVLAAQEFVESSYSPDVIAGRRRSSAGAYGISQFIASTGRSYGVRPGTSRAAVRTQIHGHAKYLHALGASQDLRRAIASYAGGPGNPQYGYAAKVLGLSRSYRGIGRGGGSGRVGGSGGVSRETIRSQRGLPSAGSTAAVELLAAALGRPQQAVSSGGLVGPSFSAHAVLPGGYAAPVISGGGGVGVPSLDEALAKVAGLQGGGVPHTAVTRTVTRGGRVVVQGGGRHAATGGVIGRKTLGRVDQGVDFSGSGKVPAFGDGVVTRVVPRGGPSGWPGGGFIVYKLTSGKHRGKFVYVAENITPTVRVGQRIRAGQKVAHAHGAYPFLETGWAADANGTTLARVTSGYTEGQRTPAGRHFLRYLGLA